MPAPAGRFSRPRRSPPAFELRKSAKAQFVRHAAMKTKLAASASSKNGSRAASAVAAAEQTQLSKHTETMQATAQGSKTMRIYYKTKTSDRFRGRAALSAGHRLGSSNGLASIDATMKALSDTTVPVHAPRQDSRKFKSAFLDMLRFDKNLILASSADEIKAQVEASRSARQAAFGKAGSLFEDRERREQAKRSSKHCARRSRGICRSRKRCMNTAGTTRIPRLLRLPKKRGTRMHSWSMLQPLRDRLLSAQPSNGNGGRLTALTDVLVLLRDIEIRQRDSFLVTTDAEDCGSHPKIKATISAVDKQRDAFRSLSEAQGAPSRISSSSVRQMGFRPTDRLMSLSTENSKQKAPTFRWRRPEDQQRDQYRHRAWGGQHHRRTTGRCRGRSQCRL